MAKLGLFGHNELKFCKAEYLKRFIFSQKSNPMGEQKVSLESIRIYVGQ